MSSSPDAMILYGYPLGGPEGWLLQEANGEYGELELPWYGEESSDDFIGGAEKVLLKANGFEDTYRRDMSEPEKNDYFERYHAVEKTIGVKFEMHGSLEYDGTPYALRAKGSKISVNWGEHRIINPAVDLAIQPHWAADLKVALLQLGLTPLQAEPEWLLLAEYG